MAPNTLNTYDLPEVAFTAGGGMLNQRQIETMCAFLDWPTEKGGLGGWRHFRNACKHWWANPDDNPATWNAGGHSNYWLEDQIRSLISSECETRAGKTKMRFISWTGCGAAGKTFASGLFGTLFWLARPNETCVILTSTSKAAIRRRVWPVIQRLHDSMFLSDTGKAYRFGNLVESKTMWQWRRGDDKRGIFAVAVEQGELQAALDRIKGIHLPYVMLVIDEANTTPEAIFECVSNYTKGCKTFIFLAIANAVSRLDNHGRCCEPKRGWSSVTIDSEQWETRGVSKWQVGPGHCLRFDGVKSPNVKAGKTIFPFLYTWENFCNARDHGDINTIPYWSQERGFWPPEGTTNTVFNEPMLVQHGAWEGKEPFVFYGDVVNIGALDPGFGGDACIFRSGRMGRIESGRMGIQLEPFIEIKSTMDSPEERDYQIAKKVIELCKERKIRPECFGTDSTGTGRGVFSHLVHEWSPSVRGVEFGGSASLLPASSADNRESKEVYHNRVTELYWVARDVVEGEQMRNIDAVTCKELCAREYTMKGRKYYVIPKADCKQLYGFSPDHADALVVLVEVARQNGLTPGGSPRTERSASWQDTAAKWDEVNEHEGYREPAFV